MYSATDTFGNSKEGEIEAQNLQAAHDELLASTLQPLEIYEASSTSSVLYFPILETLRLYAGWLLAWYSLVYAIGGYQFTKDLPIHIPYAESLFLSPLVLSFTFAAYLFLLLTSIYTYSNISKKSGVALSIVGITLFILYRINIQ